MLECEILESLIAKAEADGKTEVAEHLRAAYAAAGCGVTAESGNQPPPKPGGTGEG